MVCTVVGVGENPPRSVAHNSDYLKILLEFRHIIYFKACLLPHGGISPIQNRLELEGILHIVSSGKLGVFHWGNKLTFFTTGNNF